MSIKINYVPLEDTWRLEVKCPCGEEGVREVDLYAQGAFKTSADKRIIEAAMDWLTARWYNPDWRVEDEAINDLMDAIEEHPDWPGDDD